MRYSNFGILFFSFILSACVSLPEYLTVDVEKPKLTETLMVEEIAEQESKTDFLRISPEMKSFIASLNLKRLSDTEKINKIYDSLFNDHGYKIDYQMFGTLSAAEAFKQKRGNCLALTAMMVVLGREAGLKAKFQIANTRPVWHSENGIFTKMNHVNTVMYRGKTMSVVVDFYDKFYYQKNQGKVISDDQAIALYYNNLGSEAFLRRDIETAYYWYYKSVNMDSETAYLWTNLGVALTNAEHFELAEQAYLYALKLDRREYGVLLNLRSLYSTTQRPEHAAELTELIDTFFGDNAHYMKSLAERALMEGDLELAIKYINKANKAEPNLIDPSSIYVQKGDNLLHYNLAQHKF
ncbi:transglutaminase-like domain-containing protein [Catenovulum maritimum]|uniref:Transglutaminase-like domain-containing protein n=1 Tax=Catenovulum maritimum TaxID=1513271 RepID=A0A0J8GQT8_9ALTE|nr:transglutaminase-like domain-containing protein [Catenovulum maritimum]KMT65170.1 hypothetical protein XM47_10560 [Catenovulum maritimum]